MDDGGWWRESWAEEGRDLLLTGGSIVGKVMQGMGVQVVQVVLVVLG